MLKIQKAGQIIAPKTYPFTELPKKAFRVILADPPWMFMTHSAKGKDRSAEEHYDCMTLPEIKGLPVADLALDDAVLLMWVTDPMLNVGLDVIKAWGFTYKTVGFYWAKTNKDGSPFTGMGYWTRANPEQCLLATRGHPKRAAKNVQRLITSRRREHSRKPDELYPRIDALMGADEPKVELFAREPRPGWWSWGFEVDHFED